MAAHDWILTYVWLCPWHMSDTKLILFDSEFFETSYKHDFDPECDLSAFLTLTSESGLSDFDVNAWIKAVILIPN
jgi:hypothetical protein